MIPCKVSVLYMILSLVALSSGIVLAAPERKQRSYDDTTWWNPYVENITDVDTYLRRKFRQDVTDKTTGVGVKALKKNLEYFDYARSKYLALGMPDTMP